MRSPTVLYKPSNFLHVSFSLLEFLVVGKCVLVSVTVYDAHGILVSISQGHEEVDKFFSSLRIWVGRELSALANGAGIHGLV